MSDNELIDRIVRGVLESLQPPAETVRSSPASVNAANSEPKQSASAAPSANELRLTDAVITADLLETHWKQHSRIAVAPKAVLTPSARDYLKKRKIEVVRVGGAAAKSSSTGAVATSSVRNRWRLFVVQSHPQLERIVEETNGKGAAWERTLPTSLAEAISAAVSSLLRAEVEGGAILTQQPLVASCRANRHARIRSAAIGDVASIHTARRQIGANLYCLDPSVKSYFELRNLMRAVSSGGPPRAPDGWTE